MSQADVLLSPAGARLLGRLRGVAVTPGQELALSAELRADYPPDLVAAALTQQALRTAARPKFSRADDMLFTRAGLEQASSELTAAHSARRFAGLDLVADLCCGIGGNLTALAVAARRVVGVDTDLDALRFAGHNAAVLGATADVAFARADVRDLSYGGAPVAAVFIDPARRAAGRRLRTGDSEPPLRWCCALARPVSRVCIKAAPGLDHGLVPAGWEAEFVATGRALKEALLWSPAFATTPRRATVLPTGATLVADAGEPVPVADPGEYLLDPNPAVTRAGLVQELGRELSAWQLDPMTAFLSLDRIVSTPFARTLRVVESMPWHERAVAGRLRELGIGTVDIRRRGLAGDVDLIRRRLRLRGDRAAIIVLTRRADQPWGLICEAVGGQAADPGASP
ncbi:MAG: methyltransferase domain-containing protein [Streptosporangiaceae bacterium]